MNNIPAVWKTSVSKAMPDCISRTSGQTDKLTIQIKDNIRFILLCCAKINVIIKAAYYKSNFQIKQACAKIVILSDCVKTVVIPIMRNLQCLIQQSFSDSLI